jgi:hypothetical protein
VDIGFQRTSFTVNVSDPVDPASLSPSALKVNGIAADSDSYTPGTTTITFTYASTPVTGQGLQTMRIDAGAFTRAFDGNPVGQFNAVFRYDAVLLQVTSTNPPVGATIDINGAPLTYDVNFNEAVNPASVHTTSLTLSGLAGATVTGVTVLPGNTTARFTLAGLTSDAQLTTHIAAGAITDAFGNPGAAFNATYLVHFNLFPYPTPLAAVQPLGSLIYDPSITGNITTSTQTDSFTLPLSAGQTISLLVTPTGTTLQPTVQLLDSGNNVVASATAPAAGKPALLDATSITAPGTYTFVVSGAAGTTGGYTLHAYLDTALEEARYGGPADTSRATAQSLEPSFVSISALDSSPQRGAVVGQTQATTANYVAAAVAPTFEDISATGTRTLVGVDDGFTSVGPSQLNGFTFRLFNTTYNTVFFSSNGLITFGSGNSEYVPQNLTSDPFQAAIAPLWEDQVVTGAPDSGVYWQVEGAGSSQRLVIQWQDVIHYPSSGLFTFEATLGADGSVLLNYKTLANDNEGRGASVGLKDAGTQGPNRLLVSLGGSGVPQFVGSNKSTRITQGTPSSEYYAVNLNAGESATLALTSLDAGHVVTEELQDSGGNVLALGRSGASNVGAVINDFVAPVSGTYFVRIGGDSFTNYSLVVTRDSDFATKPSSDFLHGQAQQVLSNTTASGQTILGYVAGAETSAYEVAVGGGQTLTVQTQTPLDGQPINNRLVPKVNIFDSAGNLVASSSRSAPDGKNVLLNYVAGGDFYFVQVTSADGSAGEYVLTLSGQTGVEPDFAVTSTTPANHALFRIAPTTFDVGFNDSVLVSSVAASALTIDGVAATGFTILDATHVRFTLPTIGQGLHTVNLDSSIMDVSGRPVDAYSGDFTFDSIGPRVNFSSLQEGDVVSWDNTYTVTFDKPLDATKINASDFDLLGALHNVHYLPVSINYNPVTSTLVLQYGVMPSDQYTLTLISGPNNLVDLAGNPLDGAPHWPCPPNESGTGNPFSTGNFFVHFTDRVGTVSYPLAFTQVKPQGSLIYLGQQVSDAMVSATDTPNYMLPVNAGQTITVLVTPTSATLRPTVTLLDANGNVVATATAPAAGKPAVLEAFHVAGASGASQFLTIHITGGVGLYTVQAMLNAGLEASLYGGPSDASRGTAQDLTPWFNSLPKGASVAAVLGTTPQAAGYAATAVTPTFEDISATGHPTLQGTDDSVIQLTQANLGGFTFPLYGTTYNTVFYNTNALINFTTFDTAYSNTDLTFSPNEAAIAPLWTDYVAFNASSIVYWEVRGTGASQRLILEWKNVQFFPGGSSPFLTFEAVLGVDGSIQFNYQGVNNATRGTAGIKAAGTQGPNRLLLAFNNGPNAFVGDNKSTRIAPVAPASDFYSFHLDAGEQVSLAVTALPSGQVAEELQDSAGNILATGTPISGGNVGQAISNFTAPATGTYYVRVSGASLVNYDLVVTPNAAFDLGGNGTQATAQDLGTTAGALGFLASSGGTVRDEWFRFTATEGQTLNLSTFTPGDGGGVFINLLNPHFDLYGPDGTLVASGVIGPDGHNEQISYTVPAGAGGTYFLHITSANGMPGEFFLDPEKAAAALPLPATAARSLDIGGTSSFLTAASFAVPLSAPVVNQTYVGTDAGASRGFIADTGLKATLPAAPAASRNAAVDASLSGAASPGSDSVPTPADDDATMGSTPLERDEALDLIFAGDDESGVFIGREWFE